MRCYTWTGQGMESGVVLVDDPKLGKVVFLGEEGRGRRYEKIALDRRTPPAVVDGRVHTATLRKVTLPARDDKPEKAFWVLDADKAPADKAPADKILVRVSTEAVYTRNSAGGWAVAAGTPELLVAGHGAHGIAGRIGSWADGLIVMRPGDVLKVRPEGGYKVEAHALWVDGASMPQTCSWQDYESMRAVAAAERTLAAAPDAVDRREVPCSFPAGGGLLGEAAHRIAHGDKHCPGRNAAVSDTTPVATLRGFDDGAPVTLPAYTYRSGTEVEVGIDTARGATGAVVAVGEAGQGRQHTEVPLVGMPAPTKPCPNRGQVTHWYSAVPPRAGEPICEHCGLQRKVEGAGFGAEVRHPDAGDLPDRLAGAAVVILSEKVLRGAWGAPDKTVRIYGLTAGAPDTTGTVLLRTRLRHDTRTFKSAHVLRGTPVLTASGVVAGGAAGRADWAEDALWVLRPGDALMTKAIGRYAPASVVIQNAGGQLVVTNHARWEVADAAANPEPYVAEGRAPWLRVPDAWIGKVVRVEAFDVGTNDLNMTHEGELVRRNSRSLVLNTGYDGCDNCEVTVHAGEWVVLQPDKVVRRPDEAARAAIKAVVTERQVAAQNYIDALYFACLPDRLRDALGAVAGGPGQQQNDHLVVWCAQAGETLDAARDAEPQARVDHALMQAGHLVLELMAVCDDRRYGTGHVWVIRPDGELRDPDRTDRPKNRYSEYLWRRVSTELVLIDRVDSITVDGVKSRGTGVAYRPVTVTEAQLRASERIEAEHRLAGVFEVDPELVARRKMMMTEVRATITQLFATAYVTDLRFYDINCAEGTLLRILDEDLDVVRRMVDWAAPFDQQIAGRDAQVFRAVYAAGGVLEFLNYDKWGSRWNVNIRWRPRRDDECATPAAPVVQVGEPMMTHLGKRDFRCACGASVRMTKSEARAYDAKQRVMLCCVNGHSTEVGESL